MRQRFLQQPLWLRALRGLALGLVLAAVASFIPTPYQLEAPGRPVPASEIITIDDPKAIPVHGEYLMTTVLSEKATLMLCLYGLFNPDAVLSSHRVHPAGMQAKSPDPDTFQMKLSQHLASFVALKELGYPVEGKLLGLRVDSIADTSPNASLLSPGDILVEYSPGKPITRQTLADRLNTTPAGKTIDVLAVHEGQTKNIPLTVGLLDGKKRLGVVLHPQFAPAPLPVKIHFSSHHTVGASGGLIFALEIYDELNAQDIARSRRIAGTGTLDSTGRVGPVEGVPFKIKGAERAGATIFLLPRENFEEVKGLTTRMNLIPVDTFQDALHALS